MEQVFFKVDENGQVYIDFEALEQVGVAVDVVREHIHLISSSQKFVFDGFYVNRSAREFVILYTDLSIGDLQSCVVIPFGSHDYSVLPHDVYVRGAF